MPDLTGVEPVGALAPHYYFAWMWVHGRGVRVVVVGWWCWWWWRGH